MPASDTAVAIAAAPPSAEVLEDSQQLLRRLQQILAKMGTDNRRHSEKFKRVMAMYKRLGAALHVARQQAPAATKKAAAPPAPQRSVSMLDRALQSRSERITAVPRSVSALERARAMSRPQAAPAAAVPADGPAAGAASPAEEPVTVAAAQETAALAAQPAADEPVQQVEFPLALPKFSATMGMTGARVANWGPEVECLQHLLIVAGYPLIASGTFDAQTFRVVQEFQKENGLPANGLVGAETRRVLNELVTG